jgi:hypothetical protein
LCRSASNLKRIDIDFAHVIDEHGSTELATMLEYVVEQGGFTGAEETGENCDRKFLHGDRRTGDQRLMKSF